MNLKVLFDPLTSSSAFLQETFIAPGYQGKNSEREKRNAPQKLWITRKYVKQFKA